MEKADRPNTRARSQDKKDQKFEAILSAGMDLFVTLGPMGFTFSDLAMKVGLKRTSLYTYIKDKTQLRSEIINHCNEQFATGAEPILTGHKGGKAELYYKYCQYFFNFAEEDLTRYAMMYFIGPPPLDAKEEPSGQGAQFATMEYAMTILEDAVKLGEINQKKAESVYFFTLSLLTGGQYLENVQKVLLLRKDLVNSPKINRFANTKFKPYLLTKIREELGLEK